MEKGELIGKGREAEVLFWGNNQVLKLFWEGTKAEYVDNEYKLGQLIQQYYKFAPKVIERTFINDREGIIYEFVNGKSMSTAIFENLLAIHKFAKNFARLHAEMHKLHIPELRSQKLYFENRIHNEQLLTAQQKYTIIKYFRTLKEDTILCHGDFHMENVLVSQSDYYVIDWVVATAGNFYADVARTLYILNHGHDPSASERPFWINVLIKLFQFYFVTTYFRTYKKLKKVSLKDVKKWNLIIYAVRLGEQIQEEKAYLLKEIDKELEKLNNIELKR